MVTKYLALPSEITPFEGRFLARINKTALIFFGFHVPVLVALARLSDTGALRALELSLGAVALSTIGYFTIKNPRLISVVHGITAMLMGILLVYFGAGPVQLEMQFYCFAMLAMLCLFANPMVNLAAAATVAIHHVAVWWFIPVDAYYKAEWWVVLVYEGFIALEAVAACYISRQFFDNVVGLEKIVEARTTSLREHQRNMRLTLNNLHEGLITIGLDGRIVGEPSRALQEWFGIPVAGEKLATWIGRRDAAFGEWFDLSIDSVKEGFLPIDVALSQLPARIKVDEKVYAVRYQIMSNFADEAERHPMKAGAVSEMATIEESSQILVIGTDITERLNIDAAKRHQHDLLAAFQNMMSDKSGFVEFINEANDIVQALRERRHSDEGAVKRLVHTLKGNSAIFGMQRLTEICHNMENAMVDGEKSAMDLDTSELERAWAEMRADLEKLMGTSSGSSIEIDTGECDTVLNAISASVDIGTLARMIGSWKLEPTAKRLARIEQQLNATAERLGKTNVTVALESNGLRVDSDRFMPFWSAFIHVVRNAIDHGVETPEERKTNGKLENCLIKLTTTVDGDRFMVSIEDDGPGIDWERLRDKAAALGLEKVTGVDLLCLPGLSSKDSVSEMSGRGVGMSAVADACKSLDGVIEVTSQRGVNTRFRFIFPKDAGVYEGHSALLTSAEELVSAL